MSVNVLQGYWISMLGQNKLVSSKRIAIPKIRESPWLLLKIEGNVSTRMDRIQKMVSAYNKFIKEFQENEPTLSPINQDEFSAPIYSNQFYSMHHMWFCF